MIQLSFQFDSIKAAQDFLAVVGGAHAPAPQQSTEQPKPARKPRSDAGQKREPYGPRTKEAAAPEAQTADKEDKPALPSAPSAAAPAVPEAPAAPAAVTRESVVEAMKNLNRAKGIEANMKILKAFGVDMLSRLPEAKYPEFLAAVVAATK
jgi:hypothetical protein